MRLALRRILPVVAALVFAAVLLPAGVRGPAPIPMTVSGHALTSVGAALPIGTPIRSIIDGVIYSNDSSVLDSTGAFSLYTVGNFVINGTTPEPSPRKEGANPGERVQYAAGDFTSSIAVFQELIPWFSDENVTQDLHLASGPQPAPLKVQGIVTEPATGGSQYVLLCNPSAGSVDLGGYYLQVDRPGTYFGGNMSLAGNLRAGAIVRVNLTAGFPLQPSGDALKLVFRNPGGTGAPANGTDVAIDRVEFNASQGGTLDWQPGATIMGAALAPGPGQILERDPSCLDTNSPTDFHIAREPGLGNATAPVVSIVAPTSGATVPGGQAYTVRWSMTSNAFASAYLQVWVNVTVAGSTVALVSGGVGNTSVDWQVPDASDSGASLHIDVVDPDGNHGSSSVTFRVVPPQPYSILIAALIAIVVLVFILLGVILTRRSRRTAIPPPLRPMMMPASTAPAVPTTPSATVGSTKECPRCHTRVKAEDVSCFFCGYSFARPQT